MTRVHRCLPEAVLFIHRWMLKALDLRRGDKVKFLAWPSRCYHGIFIPFFDHCLWLRAGRVALEKKRTQSAHSWKVSHMSRSAKPQNGRLSARCVVRTAGNRQLRDTTANRTHLACGSLPLPCLFVIAISLYRWRHSFLCRQHAIFVARDIHLRSVRLFRCAK